MIPGIDVSHHDGDVDWSKVKAQGFQFAFIKATDGIGFVDPKFNTNWVEAGKVGILRSAYHFFRPGAEPYGQLNNFLKTVESTLQKPELPHAFDFEIINSQFDVTIQVDRALQWLVTCQKLSNRCPIFYSYLDFIMKIGVNFSVFKSFPLWLAEYGPEPKMPCTFWQHTDKGKVDGILGECDLNYFNGSYDELTKL